MQCNAMQCNGMYVMYVMHVMYVMYVCKDIRIDFC